MFTTASLIVVKKTKAMDHGLVYFGLCLELVTGFYAHVDEPREVRPFTRKNTLSVFIAVDVLWTVPLRSH
ncbi:hypothetical protein V6N13_044852 [Hibiscus sabdariffa]